MIKFLFNRIKYIYIRIFYNENGDDMFYKIDKGKIVCEVYQLKMT